MSRETERKRQHKRASFSLLSLTLVCLFSQPLLHSPSTAINGTSTHSQPSPQPQTTTQNQTADSFFNAPSSSSSQKTTDSRKRQLFPLSASSSSAEKIPEKEKQPRATSPSRLASIRFSSPSASCWPRKSSIPAVFSTPLFAPSASVSSSAGSPAHVPLTLPDMITPPHPSRAGETDSTAELLSVPSVLSEQSLQATASKCAITAIVFTPGVVDSSLPPLIPSEQSRVGAIPAYQPMPPSDTEETTSKMMMERDQPRFFLCFLTCFFALTSGSLISFLCLCLCLCLFTLSMSVFLLSLCIPLVSLYLFTL